MSPLFFFSMFLFVLLCTGDDTPRTFHNSTVIRLNVTEKKDLEYLFTLFRQNRTLDFWTDPLSLGDIDIRVPPENQENFYAELQKRNIYFHHLISDIQPLVERQKISENPLDFYDSYHTYDEIITWVKSLPALYPNLVTLVPLGQSYQKRELLAVKISSSTTAKPAIWIDGGIHAREWITPATVIYILGTLLENYQKDQTVTTIIDGLDIYVLPLFNVDGYAYTWQTDRMWRKTRSPNAGSTCIGTDPNRNWDYMWGGSGSSSNPCTEDYRGSVAFSEIETRTVGLYIKNAGIFKGYINFHSYSQLWMSPWGYTSALPKDYTVQNTLSARCVAALQAVHGTRYQYGPIATTIYPASGSSADYTYAAGVLYSYGVELRDTGRFGFLLPPEQIRPTGEETLAAVLVWAATILTS